MKLLKWNIVGLLFAASIFTSCSSSDNDGTTKLQIRLTDAPAAYDKVNIDIQGIKIHSSTNAEEGTEGWTDLTLLETGVYNLLDFNNGVDTLLVNSEMPSGKISQMRLILGDNNTVVINGEEIALKTPSAQQSGLKFQIHDDFVAGITYRMWIDFDADRSIVKTGNGKYNLKPTIRVYNEATSGGIEGSVLPVEANAVIYAVQGLDTIVSAIPEADGMFKVGGLSAGTYQIHIDVADTYTKPENIDTEVNLGEFTKLDDITIEEKAAEVN